MTEMEEEDNAPTAFSILAAMWREWVSGDDGNAVFARHRQEIKSLLKAIETGRP